MQLKYIEQTHVIHDQHKHLPPPSPSPGVLYLSLSLSLSLYDLLVSLTRYLKPKSIKHSYHIYIYIYTFKEYYKVLLKQDSCVAILTIDSKRLVPSFLFTSVVIILTA